MTDLDKAFKLLDAYNNPQTREDMKDKVVENLYKMGYIIRPAAGSWGLVDKVTRLPVKRPGQS